MKARHSHGVRFAWQVGDLEARHLHAAFLEPGHLLLGLCKSVDIDLPSSIPSGVPERDRLLEELLREFRELREAFCSGSLDATRFRRHYRSLLPLGSAGFAAPEGRLHRTDASKDAFFAAEQIALLTGNVIFPLHLLYSLLSEPDSLRREAMAHIGVDEACLRVAVRTQLFHAPAPVFHAPHAGRN